MIQPADTERLKRSILVGHATLADVRIALTDRNISDLTNTLHALYAMRWHRGVLHLLDDLWALKRDRYPELAWDLIERPPARIALASTLNRIKIVDTREYQEYIRSHKAAQHEFDRAQVAVGLGFNGDPKDIPLLRGYAHGENRYVVQSAVTALGLMESEPAKQVLIDLGEEFKEKEPARSTLIGEVLRAVYRWPPDEPPASKPAPASTPSAAP